MAAPLRQLLTVLPGRAESLSLWRFVLLGCFEMLSFIRFIEGVSILFYMIDSKDVVLFKILTMETTSTIRQVVDYHGGSMISQYK